MTTNEESEDTNAEDAENPGPESGELDGLVEKLWLPQILVAIATFVAVVAVFSTWVRVQALDTDQWVSTSGDLLDEPEIQSALAVYLVDQLYEQLDITAEIENRLPQDFEGLAGPITSALRGSATTGAERLVSSDRFRSTWLAANRVVHQSVVNVLRDETREGISTTDGTISLELGEILRVVGEDLGLSGSLLDQLPEDAGRLTIFESEELETAQTAVAVLDFLSWFLFLLVVVLYAVAVYFDRDRRLARLQSVGLSILGVGVFVLLVRLIAVPRVTNAVVEQSQVRPLAELVGLVATSLIREIAWSAIVYGVLIVGFVQLLGTHPWAVATRRVLAPVFGASPAAVAGITLLLLALLIWWSPGQAFDRWISGLTLVALVVGAVVALRRSIMLEAITNESASLASAAPVDHEEASESVT